MKETSRGIANTRVTRGASKMGYAFPRVTSRERTKRRGQALVELLVVIGIIIVLFAILTPVLGRIRAAAKRTFCQSNLKGVGTALEAYTNTYSDYYPYGGAYDDIYKPCPESLLHLEIGSTQEAFFCPEDEALDYHEAVREYGWWVASKFWLPDADKGERRYVRAMFRFDRLPVEQMESSYIWNEFIVSDATMRSSTWSPGTLGIASEGRHVVNRWEWKSLNDDEDCRIDQKHVDDTVNVLYGDGHVKWISAVGNTDDPAVEEISKVRCEPSRPTEGGG